MLNAVHLGGKDGGGGQEVEALCSFLLYFDIDKLFFNINQTQDMKILILSRKNKLE